jgi:hypothetical protein
MGIDLLSDPLCVIELFEVMVRVHDTITRESDGLMPLSPWSWTYLPFSQGRREEEVGQLLE